MKTVVIALAILLIAATAGAVEITKDVNLDIRGLLGTHYSVNYNEDAGAQNLNISRNSNNWYGEAEVGVTYKDLIRPFIGYREANRTMSIKEAGVDIMPVKNFGIRNSYQRYDIEGVGYSSRGFIGVTVNY